MREIFSGLLVLLRYILCSHAEVPSVKTQLGTINGDRTSVSFQGNSYTVDRYFGIPYAKPPIGDRRFKKPEPFGALDEPFNAVTVPPSCPQYTFGDLVQSSKEKSEDCLFLNIYVPQQKPDQKSGHAVMFFIHGGGFTMGSGVIYKAEKLASVGNVIVVVINYRIGVLGFLDLGNGKGGNFGLWDQRLALQWVNQNIHSFGGDKDRVTIFGESAGSVSVNLQMLYPHNKGLFRAAIAESGTIRMSTTVVRNNSIAEAKFYAESLGCSTETTEVIMKCLKEASAESIIKVADDALALNSGDVSVAVKIAVVPTVDGEFIRMKPAELHARSKTEILPEVEFLRSLIFMNGINGAEGTVFLQLQKGDDPEAFEVTREQMRTQQVPAIAAMAFGFTTAVPEAVKKMIEYEYTDWSNPHDPKRLRHEMVKAYGDIMFTVPGIELSRMHANGSDQNNYLYNFNAFLNQHFVPTPQWVGKANHADELDPVFGYNFDYGTLRNQHGYVPPDWELELSSRMMLYWSNFAKSGDPNKPVQSDSSSPEWPMYDLSQQRHFIFDREDSVGQFLYAKEYDFWRNVLRNVYDELAHVQTLTAQYAKQDDDTCEKEGTC